ncbi:Starch-binding associating with outer membrane [Chitinophaga sp. CF118]|uniref:RagB/SusD family nutrient uptake outer membrane protein n=1 Tax=Chitinophaga sp. CF118 TaxID=1884367 RepID=UPI0008E56653|nr:RagB/SusD family nutrient uptake outer membrane protein [Chitinophaga sp. CF118]SFE98129.1 Starch-binding associating with outer membrane [Chitinophaga sp. CF118]
MYSLYNKLSVLSLFQHVCKIGIFNFFICRNVLSKRFTLAFLFLNLILFQTGCKKLVEVDPPVTSLTGSNVFSSDATAIAVVTGIYINMSQSGLSEGGITSMSLLAGLSSDELALFNGVTNITYIGYYQNALSNSNTGGSDFWNKIYPSLYVVNSAIEGLVNAVNLTPAIKQQLIGEAKFMRAFYYFYLVNLYGDLPLITGIDYTINGTLSRSSSKQVWQQIISDLKDAQNLLSDNYLDATLINTSLERVRPNRGAATALLARVYLYSKDWVNAENQATVVITNSLLYSLTTLENSFLKNNLEAIWQLQPVNLGQNTLTAIQFILPVSGPNSDNFSVYLSSFQMNSFEVGDQRRYSWIDSVKAKGVTYYYPYKYKVNKADEEVTEYQVVLRLAELYLIRAEARVEQNNISGAQADLNKIRNRAGLSDTKATAVSELLVAIQHERQTELFTEWGDRWLDLKRTGEVDAVMGIVTPKKGGDWNTNWQLYPIPLYELQRNHNLFQNKGY